MSHNQSSPLMNVAEVAAYINRSEATCRYWIATGAEIGPLFGKFGSRRMARKSAIDQWIDGKFVSAVTV